MDKDKKMVVFKNVLRRVLIILSGVLFAVYAAYNLFIVVRNGNALSEEGMFISMAVALLFVVLALFAWSAGVTPDKPLVLILRHVAFIIALSALFLLKLRMVWQVVEFFDPALPYTVLYAVSYALMQLAILMLLVFYIFIVKSYEQFPRASVLLPLAAMLLFVCGFVLEIILFFAFGVGVEDSPLRTMVIRPIFYFGFISLSAYFWIPAPIVEEGDTDLNDGYINPDSNVTFIDGNVYE